MQLQDDLTTFGAARKAGGLGPLTPEEVGAFAANAFSNPWKPAAPRKCRRILSDRKIHFIGGNHVKRR